MTKGGGKGAGAANADSEAAGEEGEALEGEAAAAGALKLSYDYLLSMPLWSLTLEKVEALVSERDGKEAEVTLLRYCAAT
eukprot:6808465-Pyramimonas_sp.AAC.1